MNLLSLPATKASGVFIHNEPNFINTTSTEAFDENQLYITLSNRLISIEKQLEISVEDVGEIQNEAEKMILLLGEKQELLKRCEWLFTLEEVKSQLDCVQSLEEVKGLRNKLKFVQTSPLKKDLHSKLLEKEKLVNSSVKLSPKETLIEEVISTGNQLFLNLGHLGREAVIESVLENGNASVEFVLDAAEKLEQTVLSMKEIESFSEFERAICRLPLVSLNKLTDVNRKEVMEFLFEKRNWNGLSSIDRLMNQFINQLNKQLMKSLEILPGVQETLSLNDLSPDSIGK